MITYMYLLSQAHNNYDNVISTQQIKHKTDCIFENLKYNSKKNPKTHSTNGLKKYLFKTAFSFKFEQKTQKTQRHMSIGNFCVFPYVCVQSWRKISQRTRNFYFGHLHAFVCLIYLVFFLHYHNYFVIVIIPFFFFFVVWMCMGKKFEFVVNVFMCLICCVDMTLS